MRGDKSVTLRGHVVRLAAASIWRKGYRLIDFSDSDFNLADLVFQGATEHEPAELCNDQVLDTLKAWRQRTVATEPAASAFRLEQTRSFVISYQGHAADYWPDKAGNWIGECLVREFLFRDGICQLDSLEARLYTAKYKLEALIDVEYLLVCPYPTEAGNINGMVVVCVNQHLRSSPAAS